MFERFDDGARRVLVLAQDEAGRLDHGFIGTEHLLLALLRDGEGVAAQVLTAHGASLDDVRERVRAAVAPASRPATENGPAFTPRARRVLELSLREALQLGQTSIAAEHVLLGLIREGEGLGAEIVRSLGDVDAVHRDVVRLAGGESPGTPPPQALVPPGAAPRRPRAPRCQHCLADLQGHARARHITVPDDNGGAPVPTTVVYCSSCGRDLVAAVDRPGPPPLPA